MIFTYIYHHGIERLPYAIVVTSEMIGGYLAGRIMIQSAADYRRFVDYLFLSLMIFLPFAIFELFTFRAPIIELLGMFFPTQEKYLDARTAFNLSRVQVVFPHAILFGLYCSFILGNVYYLYGGTFLRKVPRVVVVGSMSWMSLSSAAILSLAFQLIMILWDIVMRRRWKMLLGIVVFLYVFLSVFSNRGPVILVIEYLTLNPRTAWWRVHQWDYGTISVGNHPLFGIGLNDWERPHFLVGSVDNFWLLLAMRHGLPLIICFVLAIAVHILQIVRQKGLDADLSAIRTGYMVSLVGLILTLATVHVWNALAALVSFYIGAGAFLYTRGDGVIKGVDDPAPNVAGTPSVAPDMRYTRFAPRRGKREPVARAQARRQNPDLRDG
jgi:hypothetical protein